MKTAKDFRDGHIWFSVISRPPCSTFTRVQRVSCCFSLLLCTMLTSIMFWGIPTDPSEQTMDLGMTQNNHSKLSGKYKLEEVIKFENYNNFTLNILVSRVSEDPTPPTNPPYAQTVIYTN